MQFDFVIRRAIEDAIKASFVTENKVYCVYIAPDEEMIREHGRQGGFPVTGISKVKVIIDPMIAEG